MRQPSIELGPTALPLLQPPLLAAATAASRAILADQGPELDPSLVASARYSFDEAMHHPSERLEYKYKRTPGVHIPQALVDKVSAQSQRAHLAQCPCLAQCLHPHCILH